MGKVCRAKVAEHVRLGADHARIGRALWNCQFRLDVHKLKLDLKGVSHESFVFISSTFLFERNHESFASHDSFVFTS